MMMNSTSAVYGCPPAQQHPHHHSQQTTLDYDSKLFYPAASDQQHPSYGYAPDPVEPQTGHLPPHQIINEPNGLSYTNLDASAGQSVAGHHYRQSAPYSSSCGHFYQSFDYDTLSGNHPDTSTSYHQSAGYHHHTAAYHHHHQAMGRTSRTNGIVYPPSGNGGAGYPGFESGHHVQQECQQMNGGVVAPYQRTVHQHQQQPVPTYKWMQVKRSLPKPGE